MGFNLVDKYSELPKSGKRQNWNFWQLGFQHVPITDIRAFNFIPNLSKIGTFGYQQFGLKPNNFGPNCTTSEINPFELLRPKPVQNPNHFVPFILLLVRIPAINFCPKSEQFCPYFGCCLNTKPSRSGPKAERPRTKLQWMSEYRTT